MAAQTTAQTKQVIDHLHSFKKVHDIHMSKTDIHMNSNIGISRSQKLHISNQFSSSFNQDRRLMET